MTIQFVVLTPPKEWLKEFEGTKDYIPDYTEPQPALDGIDKVWKRIQKERAGVSKGRVPDGQARLKTY